MENCFSYKVFFTTTVTCLSIIYSLTAFGQTIKLAGTIKDNREVLQGVQIKEKQTGKKATTDADGRFEMDVDANANIQISAKGYLDQTLQLNNQQLVNVKLSPDSNDLHKLLIKKIKQIEPYAHFLQAEKQAVIKLTPAYYQARLTFVKDVYFENPHVQNPDKALKVFLDYCKAQNLLNNHQEQFAKAARTLGFELITDASPVNMDKMIPASTAYRNIAYTTPNGYSQKLDLFLPKSVAGKAIPCVVFMHDGGWAVHKRAWFEAHARYLAAKGYAAINIDYRMIDAVTPLQSVYDAKAAVRWVKANAQKFNIDTNKIGACGASAGAHLAAILATSGNDPKLEGDGDNLKFSSKIQAAAGFATPTLTGRKTWPIGNGDILPDWFDKISPYKHVSPDDAPMLFIHGSADNTVAVEEPVDMFKRYKENGILTELEIKEGKGHVFYMDMVVMESAYEFFQKVFNGGK
ncbi:prolyl oligopeptidase family serine peptidase [Pedobacter psychrodurus]|uniref:prolyl oligopeptidase family serine peptidase n=1 Tax=Pedobacter psychrodurus TaxID=2530456 RepID=UPI0029309CF0|nr:prolyl oligopeptidase family serine peptidase [Pedobacter psychrodurus]